MATLGARFLADLTGHFHGLNCLFWHVDRGFRPVDFSDAADLTTSFLGLSSCFQGVGRWFWRGWFWRKEPRHDKRLPAA